MQERDLLGLLPAMVLAFGLSACAVTETGPSPSGSGDRKTAEIARSGNLPACSFKRSREDKNNATFKNYSDAANKHVIVIHSETNQSKIERGDGELPTYEEQFKAVMEGYLEWRKDRGNEKGRMLLFFNGGLNATKFTKDAAVGQIACIKKDRVYPVYMIWSSGVVATYGEQSAYVRNGLLNKDLQPTTPLYIASDIAASIARAPQTWINETSRFIDSVVLSDPKEYSLDNDGDLMDRPNGDHKGECREAENGMGIRLCLPFRGAGATPNLDNSPPLDLKRIMELVRFGVTTPVRIASLALIVESAKEAWNNMLRRTRNTVHHPGEFQPAFWNHQDGSERGELMQNYPRSTGRFARFFHDLETCRNGTGCLAGEEVEAELKNLKLTLVGHSMGAIVINELVPEFGGLPYENIVFMAAATSIRDTRDAMVPLLRKNKAQGGTGALKLRFYNLMLHPKADAREDSAYGLLPTGSLLEWIDEVLEKPKTVLDRTMGKWRNLREAQQVSPIDVHDRMTFRIFGFDQRNWQGRLNAAGRPDASYRWPEPTTHGSFNDTNKKFWLAEFWGAPK